MQHGNMPHVLHFTHPPMPATELPELPFPSFHSPVISSLPPSCPCSPWRPARPESPWRCGWPRCWGRRPAGFPARSEGTRGPASHRNHLPPGKGESWRKGLGTGLELPTEERSWAGAPRHAQSAASSSSRDGAQGCACSLWGTRSRRAMGDSSPLLGVWRRRLAPSF
uniref:Uncharacterized protein n=1 Tax=Varanus komodoensis TaxID=61221 RepID=A0A8D2IMD1_VARKO